MRRASVGDQLLDDRGGVSGRIDDDVDHAPGNQPVVHRGDGQVVRRGIVPTP